MQRHKRFAVFLSLQNKLLCAFFSLPPDTVPFCCNSVTLLPEVPDRRIKVTVNGVSNSEPVPLNFGDTVVEISVCSPDGSVSQV